MPQKQAFFNHKEHIDRKEKSVFDSWQRNDGQRNGKKRVSVLAIDTFLGSMKVNGINGWLTP